MIIHFPQTAMRRRELLSSPRWLLDKARRVQFGCSLCLRVFSFICVNNTWCSWRNKRTKMYIVILLSSLKSWTSNIQYTYSMVVISYEICSTVYVFSAQHRPKTRDYSLTFPRKLSIYSWVSWYHWFSILNCAYIIFHCTQEASNLIYTNCTIILSLKLVEYSFFLP